MLNQRIRGKIEKKAVSLEEFGIDDLAWEKESAKELVNQLLKDSIGILGGDVYRIHPDLLEPLYDSWSCEPKESESKEEYYLRSKLESLKYIENYPVNSKEGLLFSITFTDRIR